jgi:hypothetical protein
VPALAVLVENLDHLLPAGLCQTVQPRPNSTASSAAVLPVFAPSRPATSSCAACHPYSAAVLVRTQLQLASDPSRNQEGNFTLHALSPTLVLNASDAELRSFETDTRHTGKISALSYVLDFRHQIRSQPVGPQDERSHWPALFVLEQKCVRLRRIYKGLDIVLIGMCLFQCLADRAGQKNLSQNAHAGRGVHPL